MRFLRLVRGVAIGATLAGCSLSSHDQTQSSETTASAASALTPSQGLRPYPIRYVGRARATGPDGKPVVAWSGSLSDLLAADAWATCAQNTSGGAGQTDGYLAYLATKMNEDNTCAAAQNLCGSSCEVTASWRQKRSASACNADTSTGDAKAIDFLPYSPIQLGNPLPASASFPGYAYARTNAQEEIIIADSNLCMAQKLREDSVSADGLLLSNADQREILEVTRERVQVAILQYSALAVAFTSQDKRQLTSFNPNQYLTILRAFADLPENASKLQEMGRDFASAIDLHTQVTDELAQLLARSASAHSSKGVPAGSPGASNWGVGSWRERLLRLLYGGDPLAAAYASNENLWQHFTGTHADNYLFDDRAKFVSEDVQGPEASALLSLARAADALYLRTTVKVDDEVNDEFTGIDVDVTSDQMYRAVEASLRHPECLASKVPYACEAAARADDVHGADDYTSTLLWQKRRIAPAHARTLVRMLGQAMPQLNGRYHDSTEVELLGEYEGAMQFTGHHELVQEAVATTRLPGAPPGVWYHLDPDFSAIPKGTAERATPFLSGYRLPTTIDAFNVGSTQGFIARWRDRPGTESDARVEGSARLRTMGAVSVLSAARDAIFIASHALQSTPSASATAFVDAAKAALPLIGGAVGTRSLAVRPVTIARQTFGTCPEWNTSNQWCWSMVQASSDNRSMDWEIDVGTTADDPFTEVLMVDDIEDVPLPVAAALDPNFQSFTGKTRASLLAAARTATLVETQIGEGNSVRRVYRVSANGSATVLVRNPKAAGTNDELAVLADRVELSSLYTSQPVDGVPGKVTPVWRSNDGKFLSFGGSLNRLAQRAWAALPYDWSRPAFDGFGMPVDWFPPTDPSLYGSGPGDTAASFYLRSAKEAAGEATTAVQAAIMELLREQSDHDLADSARKKAAGVSAIERTNLCGQSTTCDTASEEVTISAGWIDPAKCALPFCDKFDLALRSVVPNKVNLARAVVRNLPHAANREHESAPAFDEYAGGALQKAMIAEWGALKHLNDSVDDAWRQLDAREAGYKAAQATIDAADDRHRRACSDDAFRDAVDSGKTSSFDKRGGVWVRGYFGDDTAWWEPTSAVEGTYQGSSWNSGPLVQAMNQCFETARDMGPVMTQAAATKAEAWAALGAQITLVSDAGTALRMAVADMSRVIYESNIAVARADLDAQFATAGQLTLFGTYQRLHSDDVWRARAKLESARRYAASARRAIESRYVVDFASMHQPEQFVAAPADWADAIYESDLDARGAAGLSLPIPSASNPTPSPSSIATNQIADYVANLEAFVRGYAVSRPTSVVHSDSEIVTLPGPDTRETVQDTSGQLVSVLGRDTAAWTFSCDDGMTWIAHPARGQVPATLDVATACGGKGPTRARYRFEMDPWGRVGGDVADLPYELRHNARWNRFTVNVTGTGVRRCSLAADPAACANNPFLRFGLTHTGPAWVTNYDQQWRVLGVSPGRIEGGKALANEESLAIPTNAWGKPNIDLLARTELFDRPLGGTYQLELQISPEVVLANIEAVQILHDSSYWVKQQ
jgi:hypothetical protein